MNKNKTIIILSWAAVLLWMAVIFYLSSKPAEQSDELSKGVTEIVIETVYKVAPEAHFDLENLNHIVRKNAHFFAYLALGVLVLNAMRRSGVLGFRSIIITLIICVLYASSDEFHQIFVPGRGPQVKDVFIDSSGATVGIVLYMLISRIRNKVIISK